MLFAVTLHYLPSGLDVWMKAKGYLHIEKRDGAFRGKQIFDFMYEIRDFRAEDTGQHGYKVTLDNNQVCTGEFTMSKFTHLYVVAC